MDCIEVTLFVSNKSRHIAQVLRRMLPLHASLVVINVEQDAIRTAHIPATPTVVIISGQYQQAFFGFDLQRVRTMLKEASDPSPRVQNRLRRA